MRTPVELRPETEDGRRDSGPGRRPPSVRLAWAAAGLGALAGALALWILADGGPDAGAEAADAATTTAEVARRDLREVETFDGTLGFAATRTVLAGAGGTITALAPEGALRRRGDVLYRVDQRPVVLLLGGLPAWRRLEEGVEGRDVRQLERNLAALGYDPGTVDGDFDGETEDAVESWQADLGLVETGAVEPGSLVFSPGPVRIGSHLASVGDGAHPGGAVLEVSARDQVVTVELDVADRALVAEGDEVAVELPDETEIAGRIADVGAVVATDDDAASGEEPSQTVEVTIDLARRRVAGIDEAPVDVSVVTDSKDDALAVPVTALVALLGGGYAVEVDDGGARRLVEVDPGMYADGYVEIAGGSVREGDAVVVPG